ncbi:DUF1376 domain-containing protein [Sphingomonas histidinilytica]|uniref:DUF1376 domain-containing protein n=1 Tax=Rhizorhabdus histidinilytica TaxID=439228 RepID=UPI001ADA4D25|nr:DUF1376 domain-containing protein [Rhizorhabdus histidinilytica]MBO9380436.1 DUF1376 domain-containing protein [Rhizorhabdus histidinilytica]
MTAPAPLTPPDADLQDFPFMPLHVARLRDSDLAAEEHPEACWYAVLLWAASWHQIPAGSLPDNDTVLMRLVGLGRDSRTWKKHRGGALRSFVKCADGRLYHPVVAEQVIERWQRKVEQRHRTECARIKKANQRNGTEHPCPDFESYATANFPASVPYLSFETRTSVPEDTPPLSSGTDADVPRETGSKGEGEGEGDSIIDDVDDDARAPAPADASPPHDPISLAAELCRIGGVRHLEPNAINRHVDQAREWLNDGFDPDTEIIPAIRDAVASATTTIHSLKFFDPSIRQARARKEAHDHGHEPQVRNRAGRAGAGGGGGLCASPAEAILAARRNLGIDR